jgi:hypothetical protein
LEWGYIGKGIPGYLEWGKIGKRIHGYLEWGYIGRWIQGYLEWYIWREKSIGYINALNTVQCSGFRDTVLYMYMSVDLETWTGQAYP